MSPTAPSVSWVPDHVLFVVSQPYLSRTREQALFEALSAASPMPSRAIRLEGTGTNLPEALDGLCAEGAQAILVQPVGLPFSESLAAWLPGALAHWLQGAPEGTDIRFGADMALAPSVAGAVAHEALHRSGEAQPVAPVKPTLGPRGWDNPGNATDHVLVCAGPRCHFRGAPRLRTLLIEEARAAGVLRTTDITEMSCVGPCNRGPIVAHYPEGTWYTLHTAEDVRRFVRTVLVERMADATLACHRLQPAGEKVRA